MEKSHGHGEEKTQGRGGGLPLKQRDLDAGQGGGLQGNEDDPRYKEQGGQMDTSIESISVISNSFTESNNAEISDCL